MRFVGFVPCKITSTRIPRKNFQQLGRFRLVEHALRYLQTELSEVWLSSDHPTDAELVEIAQEYRVPIARDYPYPADADPVWLTHIHAGFARWYLDQVGPFDYLVSATPDNPFRPSLKGALTAVTARRPHEWFTTDSAGNKCGALEIRSREALLTGTLAGYAIVGERHPKAIDINHGGDLTAARLSWSY